MSADRPIGVFDSGVGGLTVLRSLMENLPEENFVYIGDTARLPYGTKSPQTIRKYTEQNLNALLRHQVKAVVIACNSASTQFLDPVYEGIPVFNVIEPGMEAALQTTKNRRMGLLGTKATVKSRAYERALEKLAKGAAYELVSMPAPLLVPLAEEGWDEDPITNLIVFRYLQPLIQSGIDTLILGCTHYPILRASIQKVVGPEVTLVDSGATLSRKIQGLIQSGELAASPGRTKSELFTTDDPENFGSLAKAILGPEKFSKLDKVDL